MKCNACGEEVPANVSSCPSCGERVNANAASQTSHQPIPNRSTHSANQNRGKSKVTGGVLALLLGGLGVHHFYLGASGTGILYLVATFATMGLWSFIALIDALVLFTMDAAKFDAKYNHRIPGSMEFVYSNPK